MTKAEQAAARARGEALQRGNVRVDDEYDVLLVCALQDLPAALDHIAALEAGKDSWHDRLNDFGLRIERLEAENAQLKAALRRVLLYEGDYGACVFKCGALESVEGHPHAPDCPRVTLRHIWEEPDAAE